MEVNLCITDVCTLHRAVNTNSVKSLKISAVARKSSNLSSVPIGARAPSNLDRWALTCCCLGAFHIYRHDQLITDWNGYKGQSILKYLVTHIGKSVSKDVLMETFWPDGNAEAVRRNLHQAIYSLRRTLRRADPASEYIIFQNEHYTLNPNIKIWIDFVEFENHVEAGQGFVASNQISGAMEEYGIAEGLYQGDFLEDDIYEEWTNLHRERLRDLYLQVTEHLSANYVENREYSAAIALGRKVLALDVCHESAYRRLMLCYLAQGQRHLAIQHYQACKKALDNELGLQPSQETEDLYQQILT